MHVRDQRPEDRRFIRYFSLNHLLTGGVTADELELHREALAAEPTVTYVATSGQRPDDAEWVERVDAHRARRPPAWTTVETCDVAGLLRAAAPGEPLLVDCASLWLAAAADGAGIWGPTVRHAGVTGDEVADMPAGGPDQTQERRRAADTALAASCDELVAAWRSTTARAFMVTNEVGSGVVPATASGRRYRDELGRLNARLAAESDHVVLLVAGQVISLK